MNIFEICNAKNGIKQYKTVIKYKNKLEKGKICVEKYKEVRKNPANKFGAVDQWLSSAEQSHLLYSAVVVIKFYMKFMVKVQ